MKVALEVVSGPNKGKIVWLLQQQQISVGSSPQSVFFLPDSELAVRHFLLTSEQDACVVRNLTPSKETFVNDEAVVAETAVADGDRIQAGGTTFRVHSDFGRELQEVSKAGGVSCFISYSHEDEDFVRELDSRLKRSGILVWRATNEMRGGRKVKEQVDNAIESFEKVLLVLSHHSMRSEWVKYEVRRASDVGSRKNKEKLFPIRIVAMDEIQKWELFDTSTGKDLSAAVRDFYIPDFSKWQDSVEFEKAFSKLLKDLR